MSRPSFSVVIYHIKNGITGDFEPTDINSPVFRATHYGEHSEDGIADRVYDEVGGGELGDLAASAARGGLSVARDASKIPLGAMKIPMMALDTAGTETYEALESGYEPGQALAKASVKGVKTAIEEKYDIPSFADSIFEVLLSGKDSDYERRIRELQTEGMTEKAASEKAFKEIMAEDTIKELLGKILGK